MSACVIIPWAQTAEPQYPNARVLPEMRNLGPKVHSRGPSLATSPRSLGAAAGEEAHLVAAAVGGGLARGIVLRPPSG